MFAQLREFSLDHSLFLFGPRGTGKSRLVAERFNPKTTYRFDLLDSQVVKQFQCDPSSLYAIVNGLSDHIVHVAIDEIQKVLQFLDEVHS